MNEGRRDHSDHPSRLMRDLGALREDVAKLGESSERIERAILGDERIGHVGLVDRQARAEDRLAALERDRADELSQRRGAGRLIAGVASVAAAVGGVAGWLLNLFQHKT